MPMLIICIIQILLGEVAFEVNGIPDPNCTDDKIRVLNITTNETTTTVQCSARPSSDDLLLLGVLLLVHWRVGPRELFFLDKNGTIAYNDEENIIWRGKGKSMAYTSFSNYSFGVTGEVLTKDGPLVTLEMSFKYNIDFENSLFVCFAPCEDEDELVTKTINLISRHRKCNENRYNLEYPCKFSQYRHVKDGHTCMELIEQPVTWDMAKARCEFTHRGSLMRIPNKSMDDKILEKLPTNKNLKFVWIGLQSRMLRKLGLNGTAWLDEKVPATYLNWGNRHLEEQFWNHGCVVKSVASGKWFITDCYKNSYAYICQKTSALDPGSPTLKVAFVSGQKTAFLGDELVATCSTFMTLGATIQFRLFNPTGDVTISESNSQLGASIVWEEANRFVPIGDRCFPRSTVILRIRLSANNFFSNLSCCWLREDNYTSCSDLYSFRLSYPPQSPLLSIQGSYTLRPGYYLEASCSVCVGTRGQQMWNLLTVTKSMVWTSSFPTNFEFNDQVDDILGTDSIVGDEGTSITWTVELGTKCGPRIQTRFLKRVTQDLHGSVLLCVAVNRYHFFETSNTTARSSVFTVLGQDLTEDHNTPLTIAVAILLAIFIPLTIYMTWGSPCSKITQDRKKLAGKKGKQKSRRRPISKERSLRTKTSSHEDIPSVYGTEPHSSINTNEDVDTRDTDKQTIIKIIRGTFGFLTGMKSESHKKDNSSV